MTGTKFVANPLPGAVAPYDRLYKTGDWAVFAHAIACYPTVQKMFRLCKQHAQQNK